MILHINYTFSQIITTKKKLLKKYVIHLQINKKIIKPTLIEWWYGRRCIKESVDTVGSITIRPKLQKSMESGGTMDYEMMGVAYGWGRR